MPWRGLFLYDSQHLIVRCGHREIADKIVTVLTEQADGFRRESLQTATGRKKFAAYGRKLIKASQKTKNQGGALVPIAMEAAAAHQTHQTHQMIDAKDQFQRTPLHLAVKYNHLQVVQLLCAK